MSAAVRSIVATALLALSMLSGPPARGAELPPQVTTLLEQCLARPDDMPAGAIDALQELVDRNDPAIRDLFAREAIRVGGGGNQGSAFKTLVYEAVDRRQFTLAEQLAAQVADEMGDGVEMVIRTGSSGSRHMQLNNQAGGTVRYDTLISDDDISFLGPQAEEAARRFNDLKQARGLKNARVKGFSLSSITDPTSYDLLVQQIRDPDAFVGAAGFGKIRQEIVEKGGAVILKRQGRNMVAVAQTVQDYVARNAGSTLAEIMDVAAIAADLKKFGPLTMYASAIRQMGHAGATEREQLKYLLRIYAAMEAAGSFADAASFGARKASYFSALGEQMMTAYRDKTGKMAQALLRRHDIMQIQLDAFEAVMLSTTRKVQSMIAQAEREAGRGAVNIARHPELRRMIHELAAGFALLNQTGHSRVIQEVIPGILKSLGGAGGREASLLYKVLYTAAFDAASLTAEAAEQGVTRGVGTWTRARSPAGLIEGMAEAGQNGRQARLLLAEVGSERLPGKAADGARELQRIINESNGDTFLWKMLSNQTAQKFLIEGVALAPFAAWTMYSEWSRGEMKDLSDAAFILIDFIPGGMSTKKLGTEGMTPGTVLMFAKEALYFTPAWPFVLAGDVLYLSWTVGGAVQLQAESEGLVDLLTYNGEFDDESGRPVLKRLALPGGTIVELKEIEPWLFATKAVRVKHTLSGLEFYINNLSEKANNVLDNQFMANDPGIQQMRLAVQQHLDAINWDEAAQYFQQANVGMAMGAYLNYLAGFEFVVNADKGKPWAVLYENLKKKMVERRDVVAREHMVPQLIQLAEQKRATLDAAKTLAEELAKLQQTFERMRGSALGKDLDLVKKVTAGADAASAKLSNATAEERQLAAGKYWQDALASYRRILEISETIVPAIVDRTGYTQARPLGFTWTGDPAEDLRKAEQSKAGFAADLARVTRDVREIKGGEPKLDDNVDRQALGLLAEVAFPWRQALDSQDKAEPSGGSFDKEYEAALDKVRALYAASGDLQARVDKGTRIEAGQNVMPLDKAVTFRLVVDDAQLRRALADGSLGLKWSTEPGCTIRPRDDQEQVNITSFQPETVTVTLTFEQRGARAAKATSRLTLPVSLPDTMLQLDLSPATVKAGERLSASADLDARLLGGRFHYRWSCSNCQVDAADRASVGVTAPEAAGSGTVTVEVLIEERAGQTRSLARKSASFQVAAADKKDGDKDDGKDGGKDGGDGGKADPYKPSCSYEYTEWGECVRASKTQTRTLTAKIPAGCVERSEPKLQQGCTPPPTEEDKKHQYLNCLCRCSSGWAGHIGVWYDPEGKSVPECKSSGPCFGGAGAFGCTRRHFFGGPSDCAKGCWEGVYGKGSYDPAKADKLRKDENKKYKQPLTVKIKASKNPADFGDIVELTAETAEGSGGYQWTWGGCAQDAKDASAKVLNSRDCKPCTASVTATDQDGDSASDSLVIQCTALTVKLSKERPAEDTIPVGGKAELFAEVFSGDKPANGSFTYYWEPNPDVQYGNDPKNPTYETSGGSQSRNTAVFRKLGATPVWVTVLKQVGETKMTMGESEQIRIDVVSPKLKLTADKPSPVVGEGVTITVEEEPKMGDDLLAFWWEYKGDANNPGPVPNVANQRAWSYKPKNDKPVTVTVHAKSRDNGDELDSESITVTAQKAQVTVTGPRIAGPAPMIWKEGAGLVAAERQVAEHQRVEFAATVAPAMADLRYEWRIDSSGCTLHSPSSRETGVTCSSTGSYGLTVTVKNADGAELGSGSGGLSVTISQAQIDAGKKKADASKQLDQARQLWGQGRHDEAVAAAEAAAQVDKGLAAPVLNQFSQGLKQQGWDALNKGERDTAIRKLEQAVRLNPNDQDAKKKLADARDHVAKWPQVEAKVREFDDHIANKRIWSAQKTMLAMQDILRTMAAGQSSSNPTWKRVMDDFNKGIEDYNRFSEEKSARHTQYFKEENYPEMLRNAESMRERELSPADEKECQSRIDFAKRYLKAAEFGRQAGELTRQGRYEEALQAIEQGRAIDYKQVKAAADELSATVKRLGKEAEQRRDFAASGKYYALALEVNPQDGEAIGGDTNARTFQRYADQVRAWQREIDGHIQRGDWDKSEARLEEMTRLESLLPGQPYPESLALGERQKSGHEAYRAWVEPLKQRVGAYLQKSCLDKARAGIMEMRARHLIWMDQDWTRVFLEAIDEGKRTCSMGNVPLRNNCGSDCELDGSTGAGGADDGKPASAEANGASLSLERTVVEPNTPISLGWTAPARVPDNTWVGLQPAAPPHGQTSVNDRHDTAYRYIDKARSGTMTFTAPNAEGQYDFRMNNPADDRELVYLTFTVKVAAGAATLTLPKAVYAPNEPIKAGFTASANLPRNTWVGLIPSDKPHGKTSVNDQFDLAYRYLDGRSRGELDFTAPNAVGRYDLRMGETSNDKELASVTFEVAVPVAGAELSLPKAAYKPGEPIRLGFKASTLLPRNAWVGLIPSGKPHGKTSVNDQSDVAYRYLDGKGSGELAFTAPDAEGNWDFRLNETSNDREVVSLTFRVSKSAPASGHPVSSSNPGGGADMPVGSGGGDTTAAPATGTWQLDANGWAGTLELADHCNRMKIERGWEDLAEVAVTGNSVRFTRPLSGATQRYTGTLSGDSIQGSFSQEGTSAIYKWSARRSSGVPCGGTGTVPASGQASLVPDRATYAAGDTINLRFSGIARPAAQDWIALYAADAKNEQYGEWQYLKSAASGSLQFKAPARPGSYEFRLFLNWPAGGYQDVARSPVIRVQARDAAPVGPGPGPTSGGGGSLQIERTRFNPGETITVRFTAPASWPADAWVGIVPSAIAHGDERQNDNHDITYQYLNKRTSGSLTFTAPGVGNWDFRLHDTDNNGKEFASASFQVVEKAAAGVVGTPGGSVAGTAKGHWRLVERKLEMKPGGSDCYPNQVTGREGDLTVKLGSVCGENGRVTVQARWSEPPLAIAPGERLRIDASLSASVRGTNRGIDSTFSADFDKLDVACGYSTRGPTVIELFSAGVGKAGGQRRSDIAMPDIGTLDSRTTGRLKLRLCSRHWHQYYFYEWREGAAPSAPPTPGGRDYTGAPVDDGAPPGAGGGPTGELRIEACVDGSDWLRIENSRLVHEHRAFNQIGAHPGCPASHAVAGGGFLVDGRKVGLGQLPLAVGLSGIGSFQVERGRGGVRLDGAKGLLIDDDGPGGPDVYVIRLRGGAAAPATPPATTGATRSSVSFDNGNIGGVSNKPTQPTTFTFNEARVLTLIQDYHWNYGRGTTPGTIALRDAYGTTIGPWQAEGSPGQGGVPNAYWTARPNLTLPAGTYTVVDSDPATWSHNGQSGNRGFTRVESYPAGAAAGPAGRDYTGLPLQGDPAATLAPPVAQGRLLFEVGNVGAVSNGAQKGAKFSLDAAHVVTLIQTYHWNQGRGAPPGTIALKGRDGRTYGPWQAMGGPGQGGVANAYWTVRPSLTLPAGVYVVVDSDKSTWSHNAASDGVGFTRVEGYPAGQGSPPSPGLPAPGAEGTVKQVDDMLDAIKSLKGIFGK